MAARKVERQPWNRSTRLREAPAKAAKSGEGSAEAAAAALATDADDDNADRSRRQTRRADQSSSQRPARAIVTPTGRRRRSVSREDVQKADIGEREQTRAMIERAVSVAFGTVLTDQSASFERDDADEDSTDTRLFDKDIGLNPCQQLHDKENSVSALDTKAFACQRCSLTTRLNPQQTQQRRFPDAPAPPVIRSGRKLPEEELASVVDKQNALRNKAGLRHEQHQQFNAQAQEEAKKMREFHRRLNAAAVEFHVRQHTIQSLYERVQREIRYLTATASDLDKRVRRATIFLFVEILSHCGAPVGGYDSNCCWKMRSPATSEPSALSSTCKTSHERVARVLYQFIIVERP
jgi:hypothetical protein